MQAQALLSCAAVVAQGSRRACAMCDAEVFSTSLTCGRRCGNRLAQWSRAARSGAERARSCERCAASFVMRLPSGRARAGLSREGRFCSRRCAHAARIREKPPRPLVNCRGCGSLFEPRTRCHQLCSGTCRDQEARATETARAVAKKPLASRSCKSCNKLFTPIYGNKRRLFCSAPCLRRHTRRDSGKTHRKRARLAGVVYETVNRLKVFERDGWRCQVCGSATPKRLIGSINDRAPELDHRVPIALGGGHTYENVQCACRSCNSRKGGHTIAGQLNLFPLPIAA